MLEVQYNALMYKINTALSESQTKVAQTIYKEGK